MSTRFQSMPLPISPIGFGAFKIGRNQQTKYQTHYELPSDAESEKLLNTVLDLGITLIDTAPAYGISEERIGQAISHRRDEYLISTKAGETFIDGHSQYEFSPEATRKSIEGSLRRLKTDVLDLVFIHSNGNDRWIQEQSGMVEELQKFQARGDIRAIGFSGKQIEGAELACQWADVLMVEYHLANQSHAKVIEQAWSKGIGVIVKKGLASGTLAASESIQFVLGNPCVSSLVIGGLKVENLKANLNSAALVLNSSQTKAA